MKKILVLFAIIFSFSGTVEASHVLGGEIRWKCLGTGRYLFYMTVFRDCQGIPLGYVDETINISNSPLPTNGVTSIVVRPDSARWVANDNGDTSPDCSASYASRYSCAGQDPGTIQEFYYVSDPITLTGVPPAAGWRFSWLGPCCRPGPGRIANVTTNGQMLLRAIMYSGPNAEPAFPCFDSSPEFRASPTSLICKNYVFTYNHTAVDDDLDSLHYEWDQTFNGPANNPNPLPFVPPYTKNNPTPGPSQNINNISATVDPLTGITQMAVYSGGNNPQKFITVIRVDAYKSSCGGNPPKRVASIFRELPIVVFGCDLLPNNAVNNVPRVKIDGVPTNAVTTEIDAGQTVSIPIQIEDNDISGVGQQVQTLTLIPDGIMFSRSKTLPDRSSTGVNPCFIPTAEPCAYLRNSSPFVGTAPAPQVPLLKGLGAINTEFIWQTDCKHIQTCTGSPGTNQGVYNFVMRVYDDHCPVPALNYPTITVKVRDPIPMTEPVMKGVSINLDGTVTLNWYSAIDSTIQHTKHESFYSKPAQPSPPGIWQVLDTNIRNYVQEKTTAEFFPHDKINPLNPNSPPDLFSPDGTKNGNNLDYYARMRTVSGCTGDVRSNWSNNVRAIELDLQPIAIGPSPREGARLTWNRARPLTFAPYYPYVKYESQPLFRIYANDSISKPGGTEDLNNWYLVGETQGTTIDIDATSCRSFTGFRVEMLDTVITWKQGSTLRSDKDSLETYVFSTFSYIDTVFFDPQSPIPAPKFDTIEVRADGSIFLKIDLKGKATTGSYNIYENSILPANLLASVDAINDSVVVILPNALTTPKNIILEGVNSCNTAEKIPSVVYTTFIPSGSPGASCSGEYDLTWTAPSGFTINGYSVFVDSTGGGYELVSTLVGATNTSATVTGIKKNTDYKFRVIANGTNGEVNISAPWLYTSPVTLRNNDLIPPPELRCSYVNDDGSVTLSWVPPLDTSSNFFAYRIQYREFGSTTWIDYPNTFELSDSTTAPLSIGLPGRGAQEAQYEFRMATMAGCLGDEDGGYSTINSIFVEATARANDPQKRVDVSWNPAGVDYGPNKYLQVYRGDSVRGIDYNSPFYTSAVNTTAIVDMEDKSVLGCAPITFYFVDHIDSIYKPNYTCAVRSNVDTANIPTVPPGNQKLTHISFNPATGEMEAFWSKNKLPGVVFMDVLTTNGMTSGLINYVNVLPQQDHDTGIPLGMGSFYSSGLIPNTTYDPSDSSIVLAAQASDSCVSVGEDSLHFHKSMDVDVEWSLCDSINTITWNPYVGFDTNYSIEYTILRDTSYLMVTEITVGVVTNDTTFSDLVSSSDEYFYRVAARSTNPDLVANPADIISYSNVASALSIFGIVPFYSNLTYATLSPLTNNVEVQFYRDTLTELKSYTLYRGEAKDKLTPLDFVLKSEVEGVDRFEFLDATADVDARDYYYQVVTQNECDNVIDVSNLGRTIHLTVESDDEGLRNTLRWNRYEGWDSTTAYYNVYRGLEGEYSTQVHAVVAPNSKYDYTTFIDDIAEDVRALGKFCYRVEAVQGPFNDEAVNGYPNNLGSETSNSNIVCVLQEPLMYVPNAFAPDGVNRRFGPKGQFFNYTQFEMSIYNRWGELVYITRDINKGWDGTVEGKEAGNGSYVYIIRYVDGEGAERRKKGTVTLIR